MRAFSLPFSVLSEISARELFRESSARADFPLRGSAFELRLQCISAPKSLLSHEVMGTVENGKGRGGKYLEFSRTFDSLSRSSFMSKLEMNGFS